jgi:anaerobic magnesium-protoporphyrin IX monomethyl ester cyclase
VRLVDWSDSTDRDVKIRGRHSRRFYQHADELLRHSVDQSPDPHRIAASRAGLQDTFAEVEA